MQVGACKYCGQTKQIETSGDWTDAALDKEATERCDCAEASIERDRIKKRADIIKNINEIVTEEMPEIGKMLISNIDLALERDITAIKITTPAGVHVNVSVNKDSKVKVSRSHTEQKSLER